MLSNGVVESPYQYEISDTRLRLPLDLRSAFDQFINEWLEADRNGDLVRLPLQLRAFLDEILVRFAMHHPTPMQLGCPSEMSDALVVKAAVQGKYSGEVMNERGWDAPDARAELESMLEELRSFQDRERLLLNSLDPPKRRWEAPEEEGPELTGLDAFLDPLQTFVENLLDTRQRFMRDRPDSF